MNWEMLKEDLKKVKQVNEEFAKKYEAEGMEFLRRNDVTADEGLQQELLFELLDHARGLCHVAKYMDKKVTREGVLNRGKDGQILFNGEVVPIMKEIEVYYMEEGWAHEVWTRTYVSGGKDPYLVGLDRSTEVRGMKARIRE